MSRRPGGAPSAVLESASVRRGPRARRLHPDSALNLTSHLCVRTSEGRISEFWFGLRPLPGPDGPTYIFGYTTWERDPLWPAFLHGHPVPNP